MFMLKARFLSSVIEHDICGFSSVFPLAGGSRFSVALSVEAWQAFVQTVNGEVGLRVLPDCQSLQEAFVQL